MKGAKKSTGTTKFYGAQKNEKAGSETRPFLLDGRPRILLGIKCLVYQGIRMS